MSTVGVIWGGLDGCRQGRGGCTFRQITWKTFTCCLHAYLKIFMFGGDRERGLTAVALDVASTFSEGAVP